MAISPENNLLAIRKIVITVSRKNTGAKLYKSPRLEVVKIVLDVFKIQAYIMGTAGLSTEKSSKRNGSLVRPPETRIALAAGM